MKAQLKKIIERTVERLAQMPPSQPPALMFPRDFNDREKENAKRRATWLAREQVANEAIAAMKSEIPAHWPGWDSELWNDAEMEFGGFSNWCQRMADIDQEYIDARAKARS